MAMTEETSVVDFEMSMRTMHLEREYEKALSNSASLLNNERDRVQRMEILFLTFENKALQLQLEEANGHLLGFTGANSEACAQLQEACQEIDRLELKAQFSSGEIERLKEELSTLKDNSTSYNIILAEKIHLSRNLATLQSEFERLQAQNISYQTIVAEKHEMERQINTLGVQFNSEKHAHGRSQAKGSQQTKEIIQLSAQVEELRNKLAGESHAKQKEEENNRHQNSAWANQRAMLEGDIDSLKQQLWSARNKLQEVEIELKRRRNLSQSTGNDPKSSSRTVPLQRPGPSGHAGLTISTPGAVRMQEKSKKDSAVPGDKSAFSITPFLNRTGAPSGSPLSSLEDEDDLLGDNDTTHELLSKRGPFGEPKRVSSALRRQLSPTEDRNPITKVAKPKAETHEGAIAVLTSANEGKKPTSRLERNMQHTKSDLLHEPLESEQTKPKKRKLGGQRDRSLFEEENEEEPCLNTKFGQKHAIVSGRASTLGSKQQPNTSTSLPRTLGFGAPMGFSPLKKDRRRF